MWEWADRFRILPQQTTKEHGRCGGMVWAGASRALPTLRDWNPSFGSADADMAFDTAEIRACSLERNEASATG